MVRAYLRYELKDTFGVIASNACNAILDNDRAIVGGLEGILVWNLRTGTLQQSLIDVDPSLHPSAAQNKGQVVLLRLSPDGTRLAAGYSEGTIKIWDMKSGSCILTLNGHKGPVSCLHFQESGVLLASGGQDTDVIVWDLVAETGLFRLRGHTDMVTGLHFVGAKRLVSGSKDTLLKVWDLDTQHCIQTVVGHRSEVWDIDVNPAGTRLVAGSGSRALRFYTIGTVTTTTPSNQEEEEEKPAADTPELLTYLGEVERKGKERVMQLQYNSDGSYLACLSADKQIEFFQVNDSTEMKKKQKKRKAKSRKKQKIEDIPQEETIEQPQQKLIASDEVTSVSVLKADHKIRAFDLAVFRPQVLVMLQNNAIQLWDTRNISQPAGECQKEKEIDLPGHRSAIRALALSEDDSLLISTSSDATKVWNLKSLQCVRTFESGYGLCAAFVPGNSHVLVGTKEGKIELFNLSSGDKIQILDAHTGSVWSIAISPDMQGFASASTDHDIKFWDFELVENEAGGKRLGIGHSKTLKMTDDVLSVCYSKDGKFVAASLLDNTVKVFFADTMKFFLSLYGHKLPVLSISISTDGTLLVSGSADKSVKIWGLDFGDCHKSILAHEDSVMQVKFVPNTHMFFSASKDRTIKYWDADKFEHIMTLSGHHGEIWSLAIAQQGNFILSGSHDRSIRLWRETDEQLYLEEEREMALDARFEQALENPLERGKEDKTESGPAGRRTIETIKAGERITEAIELVETERKNMENYNKLLANAETHWTDKEKAGVEAGKPLLPPPEANMLLMGKTPSQYLLDTIKGVRSTELDDALILLPFSAVLSVLNYLEEWMQSGQETELCCRCLFYLLKLHQNQITANRNALAKLQSLQSLTRQRIQREKDIMGYNRAAMRYLVNDIKERSTTNFFDYRGKAEERRTAASSRATQFGAPTPSRKRKKPASADKEK